MPILPTLLASCESLPTAWHEPLYVPVLFTMVGVGVFAAGKVVEVREMKSKPWKWWAVLPMAIALYSGLTTANCMRDAFYWSAMMDYGAKKFSASHIGALAFPLLAIIGMGIWQWRSTRDPFRH